MLQEKQQTLTTFEVSLQTWADQILSQAIQLYSPKITYSNETKVGMFHSTLQLCFILLK